MEYTVTFSPLARLAKMLDEVEALERNIKWEPLSTLTYFVVVLAGVEVSALLLGFEFAKKDAWTYPVLLPAFTFAQSPEMEYTVTFSPLAKLAKMLDEVEDLERNIKWEPLSTLTYFVVVLAGVEVSALLSGLEFAKKDA